MEKQNGLQVIAHVRSDFPTKFGLPRQSGSCEAIVSRVVFEPEYRVAEALRGLTEYSHVWLLWGFSETEREEWSPTVRPPRLGGNTKVGVFATRSPYRPNSIGLSAVRLLRIEDGELIISGADVMDGTPVYDVKPYLLSDCHTDAKDGFAGKVRGYSLEVIFPPELAARLTEQQAAALSEVLSEDPRPAYQNDAERVYGFLYAGHEIKFKVDDKRLSVTDVIKV